MPTLSAGPANVVIDTTDGCRVTSLAFAEGVELMGRDAKAVATSPFHHGCFPMAPFAGRIRHGRFAFAGKTHQLPINFEDHAIHGTVCDRAWTPTANANEWRCDLDRDRWPFAGHAVQRADLTPARLRLELEVHASAGPMPATIGWHPWFARTIAGASAVLSFDASLQYGKDDGGMPDGTTHPPSALDERLDDCFTDVRSSPTITWPGLGRLEIASDASHLVVYTAPASALCVEPQTGPPDALNLGAATIVEPGRPLTAWMELRWRPAPSGTS